MNIHIINTLYALEEWKQDTGSCFVLIPSACTVVSRIYAPRFATLAQSVGVGLYAGSDILSREYAPSSVAAPR